MSLEISERFSRLRYPIHKVEAKTVAELFKLIPGLKRFFQDPDRISADPEYPASPAWAGENMLKVIRYIVFLYDENTDLTDEYPDDTRVRKEAAAKEAGWKRNGEGDWPPMVTDIMDFKDRVVVHFILNYLKLQKSEVWREIKLIEEEEESITRIRADNIQSGTFDTKSDLLKAAKERREQKELLLKRFYAEHSDLKAATEEEILPVSPENVFKVMHFPKHLTTIMQIQDVPKDRGVE